MSIQYKSVEDYCKKKADTAAQDLGAEAAEKIKRLIIKNTRKKKIEIYNTTTTAMNAAQSKQRTQEKQEKALALLQKKSENWQKLQAHRQRQFLPN